MPKNAKEGEACPAAAIAARLRSVPQVEVYDFLTGLPGRKAAYAMMARAITLAKRTDQALLTALIDVDQFHVINETKGTAFGDEALRQIADRLGKLKPWFCQAYRLGGNAFLLYRLIDKHTGSEACEALAKELKQAVEEQLFVRGQLLYTSCSIGLCRFPEHGATAELVVRHADTALRQVKAAGGNRIAVYTDAFLAKVSRLDKLRGALRNALADNALSLHYQPQYASSGKLRGFEALLRWRHPELGPISPGEFIPLAEQSGQIVEIGEWVLAEACRMLRRAQSKGLSGLVMSVNLSPVQIRMPGFVETLQRILGQSDVEPECLELEITESVILGADDGENQALRRLRGMGVRIALDDFGVGYASLTYLRKLPLHTLKLDRSFIRHICEPGAEQAIVRTMISLVHQLGFEAVAEGVETEDQLALLLEWGCDFVQGYLLSTPLDEQAVGMPLLQSDCSLFQAARMDRFAVTKM